MLNQFLNVHSETQNAQTGGLVVEVFSKNMLWDKVLGYAYITLDMIPYGYPNEITARWWPLDQDAILMNGEVVGTKTPTGHSILLDCRFELPYGGKTTHRLVYLLTFQLLSLLNTSSSTFLTCHY